MRVIAAVLILHIAAMSQSGGTFDLTHNVIAGGGGSSSSGGAFIMDGTIGQPQAGTVSTGGTFNLRGGFWASQTLITTAATVSVGGRINVAGGGGVKRVRITLNQLSTGAVRTVMPNAFGYYNFEDVEIGTYLITAEGGDYQFSPPQILLDLKDSLTGVNFDAFAP
jgi:hypothetical protein